MKKVFQEYFEKEQSKNDDQELLERACRARGGVWNQDEQVCFGLKDGKKKPIKDE